MQLVICKDKENEEKKIRSLKKIKNNRVQKEVIPKD